jgi:U3 small nucleolar RNA-associated protein 4
MFDLTKDFPISDADHAGRKRKRDALKKNSGAGNAIPDEEVPITKLRKFQSEDDQTGKQKWIGVNTVGRGTNEEDDDAEDNSQPLAKLRRSSTQDGQTEELLNGGEVGEVEQRKTKDPWWHTLKYRPILGIVPIGADDGSRAPEVVLVERPSWDLDLPPRFVGTHEQ